MNHHMQRALNMAKKRMYGDLKLLFGYRHGGFRMQVRAENRWWLHAAPPPLPQPNQRPPPHAADIVQVIDLDLPPHQPPSQDSDNILLELTR
jgi:hypothetical protein